LKKNPDIDVVLIDSSLLQQVNLEGFQSIFNDQVRNKVKFISLKDSRVTADLPSIFHGILYKPIKPSTVMNNWKQLMSALSPTEEIEEEKDTRLALNILLVEDNLVNQKVAVILLKKLGCSDITLASNGMEAVEKIKQTIEGTLPRFDLVLMDVMMPVMDGISATVEIRKLEQLHKVEKVPVIALTAHAMVDDKDKCMSVGMDGYFSKPLEKDKLALYLEKLNKQKEFNV